MDDRIRPGDENQSFKPTSFKRPQQAARGTEKDNRSSAQYSTCNCFSVHPRKTKILTENTHAPPQTKIDLTQKKGIQRKSPNENLQKKTAIESAWDDFSGAKSQRPEDASKSQRHRTSGKPTPRNAQTRRTKTTKRRHPPPNRHFAKKPRKTKQKKSKT